MQRSIPHILKASRMQHTAVCGQPGTSKQLTLAELVQFDMVNDHGLLLVDLDGDATETLLATAPASRVQDVILIDFADTNYPPAINPLAGSGSVYDAVLADNLVDTIKAISGYDSMATPDMDRTIYNTARAVMDKRGGTILDMYRMLVDDVVRQEFAATVTDPLIGVYWRDQYAQMNKRDQAFVTKSTINKLEPFLADARIRNALCQRKPLINLASALESRKIIAVTIPQSTFGMTKARMLAGLLLSQFMSLALRRRGLLPFHVHLPQIRHFPVGIIRQMLATSGRHNVSMTFGFDYLGELGALQDTVTGSVGNWVIHRMGLKDGETLSALFPWDNTTKNIHELDSSEVHIVVPNIKPMKSVTIRSNLNLKNNKKAIVKRCRHFYCRPRNEVEPGIVARFGGDYEDRHKTG